MKMLKEIETAKEVRAELESVGVTGAAAALVVKRTAHHRQARRERAAYEAAVAWATTQTVGDPLPDRDASADEAHEAVLRYLSDVAASAWLACVLDASGVGGHMGLEGAKRARHPAFRVAAPKWGVGECWTAAIRTAASRLEAEAITAGMVGFHDGNHYRFLQVGLDGEGDLIVVTPDRDATGACRHKIVMGGYGCPPDREWRRAALACWLLAKLNGPAGGGLELTSGRPDSERIPWCHCPQCSDPALIAWALNAVESEIEHARDMTPLEETVAATHDRLDEQGVPRCGPCPRCGKSNERWLSCASEPRFDCADAYGAPACPPGEPMWRVTVTFGAKPTADVSEDFPTFDAAREFARKYDGKEYYDAAVAVFGPDGARLV